MMDNNPKKPTTDDQGEAPLNRLHPLRKENDANRYISFSLGSEEYAIPLLDVREVIAVPETTPVPFTPPHFLGIMNLRGQVISVIDLRIKLGIKPTPSTETAVIICDIGSTHLGVLVDSINSVISPQDDQLSGKPEIESQKSTEYISAIYKKSERLVLIINLRKALSTEDRKAIQSASPVAPRKTA
jgi:purine-binding chemotaxis protein CheW